MLCVGKGGWNIQRRVFRWCDTLESWDAFNETQLEKNRNKNMHNGKLTMVLCGSDTSPILPMSDQGIKAQKDV